VVIGVKRPLPGLSEENKGERSKAGKVFGEALGGEEKQVRGHRIHNCRRVLDETSQGMKFLSSGDSYQGEGGGVGRIE